MNAEDAQKLARSRPDHMIVDRVSYAQGWLERNETAEKELAEARTEIAKLQARQRSGGLMRSDSGMTPEKAREIQALDLEAKRGSNEKRKALLKRIGAVSGWTDWNDIARLAEGFLLCVAYQEEKAKGLVEALEFIEALNDVEQDHAFVIARDALAHYRQGQEKPLEGPKDGRE